MSSPVTFTVNNTAPTTTVVLPRNGASEPINTDIILDATASPGVTSVSFELDGKDVGFQSGPILATPTIWGWVAVIPMSGEPPPVPRRLCCIPSIHDPEYGQLCRRGEWIEQCRDHHDRDGELLRRWLLVPFALHGFLQSGVIHDASPSPDVNLPNLVQSFASGPRVLAFFAGDPAAAAETYN